MHTPRISRLSMKATRRYKIYQSSTIHIAINGSSSFRILNLFGFVCWKTTMTKFSLRYKDHFPWCAPDPKDAGSARCTVCNKSFKIDTMGKKAFTSHEKGKYHVQMSKAQSSTLAVPKFFENFQKAGK